MLGQLQHPDIHAADTPHKGKPLTGRKSGTCRRAPRAADRASKSTVCALTECVVKVPDNLLALKVPAGAALAWGLRNGFWPSAADPLLADWLMELPASAAPLKNCRVGNVPTTIVHVVCGPPALDVTLYAACVSLVMHCNSVV